MAYIYLPQKLALLFLTLWIWLPIVCFNQWFWRPFILVWKQLKKSFPSNMKRTAFVFCGGVIGFAIVQLLYVYQSFEQIPKNFFKFLKNPYYRAGFKILIWEERNKMEDMINDFFDDTFAVVGDKYAEVEVTNKDS